MSMIAQELEISEEQEQNIFGQYDSFLKKVERALHVEVISRNGTVLVQGEQKNVSGAMEVFAKLKHLADRGNTITEQNVDYAISLCLTDNHQVDLIELDKNVICHNINGKPIKPKTEGQRQYIQNIRDKMIVFGIGPAGTGKTYLAMAMAITAFKNNEVNRIILTRPAIEAGEKLGFLPGDLQSKIDPYLRPLYDALYEIMGAETFLKNQEKGLILDEAQNTTPAQMKMFLTRIGFGSKAIITGDLTQKDLPPDAVSGLDVALMVLKNLDEIGFSRLTSLDVVRHPLVQKIVAAYDRYEERKARAKNHDNKSGKRNRSGSAR